MGRVTLIPGPSLTTADMYKEAAANQHKQEAVSSIISSGAAESDLCSSAYEDDSIIIGDACPQRFVPNPKQDRKPFTIYVE